MSIRSVTYQQSVFKRYHSGKHLADFTYIMAAKITRHRYGTKLRHCHSTYNLTQAVRLRCVRCVRCVKILRNARIARNATYASSLRCVQCVWLETASDVRGTAAVRSSWAEVQKTPTDPEKMPHSHNDSFLVRSSNCMRPCQVSK